MLFTTPKVSRGAKTKYLSLVSRYRGGYGVLGEYDFVSIVETDDTQSIARFSLEMGVRAVAHITTLPAIPIGQLEAQEQPDLSWAEASITPSTSGDRPDEPEGASGQSTDSPVPAS
jgi:uncharacterized protein with GYD domain